MFSLKALDGELVELIVNQEFSQVFNSADNLVRSKLVAIHGHGSNFGFPAGVHPENI